MSKTKGIPHSFLAARTNWDQDAQGLINVRLGAWIRRKNSEPEFKGYIIINSGTVFTQTYANFKTWENALPGRLEPCPQGRFELDPRPQWKGGVGLFQNIFSPGAGSVFLAIHVPYNVTQLQLFPPAIFIKNKSDRVIYFHEDFNRASTPGSAGCLVFKERTNILNFLNWVSEANRARRPFKYVYVDWGKVILPGAKLKYDRNIEYYIERDLGITYTNRESED